MKLEFNSVEELRDFVKSHLKGQRGGKAGGDDGDPPAGTQGNAPQPMMPPQQGQTAAFQPQPQQPATFQPAAFPGAGGPTGGDPAVAGLVNRINARIDGAIQNGQPADAALTWFRGQCGAEAANATMDQIKQVFLPKQTVPALEQIAKLMNA